VDLIQGKNGNGQVDSGEVLGSASAREPQLNRLLEPGSYYVRVRPYSSGYNVTYTLTLSVPYNPQVAVPPGQFERTPTGFIYPIGRSTFASNMPGWLAGGPNMPQYHKGYYHLGVDMDAPRGAPVYAIADGEIVYVSTNNWGAGNYGVFIRHRLASGEEFLALYGHVRPLDSTLRLGYPGPVQPRPVRAGEIFATVGPADGSKYWDDHLHFGIVRSPNLPPAPFGSMPLEDWPKTNGFVDPLAFICTERPAGAWTPPTDPVLPSLNVEALAPNVAHLTWRLPPFSVQAVQIERRSVDEAIWRVINELAGTAESFFDQTVAAGKTYYYRIGNVVRGLLGGYSNEVSITTPAREVDPLIYAIEPEALLVGRDRTVTVRGKNFLPGFSLKLIGPSGQVVSRLRGPEECGGNSNQFSGLVRCCRHLEARDRKSR